MHAGNTALHSAEEIREMIRKKVLLVDSAFSSLPIHSYLESINFEVWTIGNRSEDVLAQISGKRWIQGDYSNIDFVRDRVEQIGFDYIVPGCTDVSIETCSQIDKSNLVDEWPAIFSLNNKFAFRGICRKLNIPSPQIIEAGELPASGRYMCKPVDSYSGKGITIFDASQKSDMENALSRAQAESPTGRSICEEFIEGDLYSFSAFIENKSVVKYFVVREGSSANPFAVDTSFVIHDPDTELMTLLTKATNSIANYLRLNDGLFHLQYILKNGLPYFIEATRRCPGDLYSLLIEYSTGYRYAAKFASYFVKNELSEAPLERNHVIRHTISSTRRTINAGLKFNCPLEIQALYPLSRVGEQLIENQKVRFGVMFSSYKNEESQKRDFQRYLNREIYEF